MTVRVGVEALIEEFKCICSRGDWGRPVFFMAPTGYGKTSSTPLLHKASLEEAGSPRTIHVLPLRAVVEQVYRRFSSEMKGFTVGYQAHGLGLLGKTPFMASDLVVSTLDSFLINLFRGNVAEGGGGQGHYEVPRAFVLTSTIVFDEVHMPLQAHGKGSEALHTAVAVMGRALVEMKCPFIIESATLPPCVLRKYAELLNHPSPLIIEPVSPGCKLEQLIPGARRVLVEDHDFFENALSIEWFTGKTGDPVSETIQLLESGCSVFRAVNTVKKAVEEYKRISEEVGEENVALVHGRMTPPDRRRQLEKLEKIEENGALIGTQAVEAGVDTDFAVLITDPVCPESLIQRIGRVNRRMRRERAQILVARGEECDQLLKRLESINPRIPYDYKGVKGYTRLFKKTQEPEIDVHVYDSLMKLTLTPIISASEVREIHSMLCDVVRGRLLVPVAPHPDDLGLEEDPKPGVVVEKDVWERLLENVFPVDQYLLYEKAREWLELREEGALALSVEWSRERNHPGNIEYKMTTVSIESLSCCGRLKNEFSLKRVVLLILKKKAYKPGLGLC